MKLFARAVVVALMMVLAVALVGCGDDEPKTTTPARAEVAVGTNDAGCTPAETRLESGTSRLAIVAKSAKNNSYAIETDTGKRVFARTNLVPNTRLAVDVTLEPGEYYAVCGDGKKAVISVVGEALSGAEAAKAKKGDVQSSKTVKAPKGSGDVPTSSTGGTTAPAGGTSGTSTGSTGK